MMLLIFHTVWQFQTDLHLLDKQSNSFNKDIIKNKIKKIKILNSYLLCEEHESYLLTTLQGN